MLTVEAGTFVEILRLVTVTNEPGDAVLMSSIEQVGSNQQKTKLEKWAQASLVQNAAQLVAGWL